MIGQTISHYQITAKLGSGGMGEVYLATDTKLNRPVALKFLPESLSRDPVARERLQREAQAASQLNHPNILTIYAVEEDAGRDFIVMEYVEGKTLKESVASGTLTLTRALDLAIQIGDGLNAAHERHVVHRDIKADNILITPKGQVKIMDFGLAKVRGASQLTETGSTVGTLAYMSPEQALGQEADHRADIFSFGVVLYELLTGRLPFAGEHHAAILYAIVNETPPPLSRYTANLPDGVERIVAKAMDKEPESRYQHADDLVADLRTERKRLDYAKSGMIAATAVTRKPKRGYLKYLIGTSVVFAAALVLLILKPFKVEIVPEQKAAAAQNSLAVMYFDNLVDADDKDKTAEMAANLLITGLSESQYLKVVSRQRLYDVLNAMGKDGIKTIDHNTATEVAARANVKWIVTGKVFQIQPRIVLSAEVAEAGTGQIATTQRVNGEPGEDLFAVIDKLGASLRTHMSLPEAAKSEETKSVAEVTTHSSEAYRHYLEGVEYRRKFYTDEAMASFLKALTYDSTYAMAYYQLSLLPGTRGDIDPRMRHDWIATAERFAGKASWKEQRYIRAGALSNRGDLNASIAAYGEIVQRFPDEKEALKRMGEVYNRSGRYAEAADCYERAIAIDPSYKDAYNLLAYVYNNLGNLEKSLWAINQYITLAPDEPNPYDTRGDLYAYNGNPREAIESYRLALQKNPGFGTDNKLGYMFLYAGDYARAESTFQAMAASADRDARSQGRAFLPLVSAYRGQFQRALDQLEGAISADRMEQYDGTWYIAKLQQKAMLLAVLGRFDKAIPVAQKVTELSHRYDPNDAEYRRFSLALLYARSGDSLNAWRVLDEVRRDVFALDDTSGWQSRLRAQEGYLAFYEGRMDEAIPQLQQKNVSDRSVVLAYHLGQAYLQHGLHEKAVAELERAVTYLGPPRAQNPFYGVRCIYLLGRAYEESGWKDKAVQQYQTFLDIWKDADPGIKEIDDAKARLARLRS